MTIPLCFGLSLGAAVALWVCTWRRYALGCIIAKPLASFAFVVAAMGAATHASYYGQRVGWATSLAMVGDVLLLRAGKLYFLLALAFFLVGHGLYIDAFLHQGFDAHVLGLALALLMVPSGAIEAWLRPHLPRNMTWPVYTYLLIITLMLASAISAVAFSVAPTQQILGASFFYLSDLFVARQAFVRADTKNALLGLPLYYTAQWLLVATLGVF